MSPTSASPADSAATIPASYQLRILAQGGRRAELEAPAGTTIGQLRSSALNALEIQPEPNVQWFLHYQGEQLNDDGATLAQVVGPMQNPRVQVVLHLKKQPFAGASISPAAVDVAPEPTRTYIERAVAALRARAYEFAVQEITVNGIDVYVTLLARDLGTGREPYTVRLRCDGYDLQPPAVTMVDPVTRAPMASAWPNVPDGPGAIFRPVPGNLAAAFICTPGTREWFGHGHTEFRAPEYWTFVNIIEAIHLGLQSTGYRGRWLA